jgi:hypothetical protein
MRAFFSPTHLLRYPLNCGIWVILSYAAIIGILSALPYVSSAGKNAFDRTTKIAAWSDQFAKPHDNDYEYIQPFLRTRSNLQSVD